MLPPCLRKLKVPIAAATLVVCPLAAGMAQVSSSDGGTHRRGCNEARPLILGGDRSARGPYAKSDTIPHCLDHLEIFGQGNVKDALGSGSGGASPSGALGVHYTGSRYDVTGLVNVAGSSDTVRSGFGGTVLLPSTGGGLNAASLVIRMRFRDWGARRCADYYYSKTCNMGLRLALDASTRVWATQTGKSSPAGGQGDSVTTVTGVTEVPMWGVGLGVWYSFFDAPLAADSGGGRAAMLLDLGLAHRAIRGALGGTSEAQTALRDSLLNDRRHDFTGLEVGLTLQYNQVRSTFTYYLFNGHADGFSGGEIVATVSLDAAIASRLLTRH